MCLSTSDRQALRDHLTSEFHRWVEDLLSRDELSLVGSAVPAMKQPPPRRGNRRLKDKTKTSKKTTKKTTHEEDKTTDPTAPTREDQCPAPAASTQEDTSPEDSSRENGWSTARSSKRRRSLNTSQTATKPDKKPRTPATPTPSSTPGKQCHNCQGFGHSTRSCQRQPVCAQWSGSHRSTICVDQRIDGIAPNTTVTCAWRKAIDAGPDSARIVPSRRRSPSPPTPPLWTKMPWTPHPLRPPPASAPARPPRPPLATPAAGATYLPLPNSPASSRGTTRKSKNANGTG